MKMTVERRAVHIAAVIMQRDGLCRYEAPALCRKVYPPDEAGCVRCIESWLLSKARSELKKGQNMLRIPVRKKVVENGIRRPEAGGEEDEEEQ